MMWAYSFASMGDKATKAGSTDWRMDRRGCIGLLQDEERNGLEVLERDCSAKIVITLDS